MTDELNEEKEGKKMKTLPTCFVSALINFEPDREQLYRKAIELYEQEYPQEKGVLYITPDAYDITGRLMPNRMALRHTKRKDYSKFWHIFEKLNEVQNG